MSVTSAEYFQRQIAFIAMSSQHDAGIDISKIAKTSTRDLFLSYAQGGMLFTKEDKATIREAMQKRLIKIKSFLLLQSYQKELNNTPLPELISQIDQIEKQNKECITLALQTIANGLVQEFSLSHQIASTFNNFFTY